MLPLVILWPEGDLSTTGDVIVRANCTGTATAIDDGMTTEATAPLPTLAVDGVKRYPNLGGFLTAVPINSSGVKFQLAANSLANFSPLNVLRMT